MNTTQSLFESLKAEGIILYLLPNNRIFAQGTLTEANRTKIRESKDELVCHLVEQKRSLWQQAFHALLTKFKPKSISEAKWEEIQYWAHILSGKNNPYLENFIQYCWVLKDIFGCHSTHPYQRLDYMGLILLLGDKAIHEVTKDGIILKTPSGASQTYRRPIRPLPDQITLMELEDDPAVLSTSATPKNEPILNLLSAEAEKQPPLIKPEPTRAEIVVGEEVSLVRPFEEIKAAELEKYYWYYKKIADIRHFHGGSPRYDGEKHLTNSAEWQAMNDTTYKFMEDNNVDQSSLEVNQFIRKMLR